MLMELSYLATKLLFELRIELNNTLKLMANCHNSNCSSTIKYFTWILHKNNRIRASITDTRWLHRSCFTIVFYGIKMTTIFVYSLTSKISSNHSTLDLLTFSFRKYKLNSKTTYKPFLSDNLQIHGKFWSDNDPAGHICVFIFP